MGAFAKMMKAETVEALMRERDEARAIARELAEATMRLLPKDRLAFRAPLLRQDVTADIVDDVYRALARAREAGIVGE